ncbi:MAG: hypothetical protein ACM3ML_14100 [Micromonosporaceae bacterium]
MLCTAAQVGADGRAAAVLGAWKRRRSGSGSAAVGHAGRLLHWHALVEQQWLLGVEKELVEREPGRAAISGTNVEIL